MRRTDKAEKERRIDFAYRALLGGATASDLCHFMSESWGVSYRQAARYLRDARALIAEQACDEHAYRFAEALMARRQLRREAHQAGDLRLVLDVLRDEARLLGLYPPARHEIGGQPALGQAPGSGTGGQGPITIVEVPVDDELRGEGADAILPGRGNEGEAPTRGAG